MCYESLYTHTIPWAAHGKSVAKLNRNASPRYWGNSLDKWVQKCQDGQTRGLPIGPDASLVISEIVLSASDVELQNMQGSLSGFRHYDDYDFAASTNDEADEILGMLGRALSQYELSLNSSKTQIIDLPHPVTDAWILGIDAHRLGRADLSQRTDIQYLFDAAFSLVGDYPDKPILKYVVGWTDRIEVEPEHWPLYQNLLLRTLFAQPDTTPYVLSELVKYRDMGRRLDMYALEAAFNSQIEFHARRAHASEVAWAIYAVMILGLCVSDGAAKAASEVDSSFVALLLLDAEERGIAKKGLVSSRWQSVMTKDELCGEHWLLSYEANMKGWLPTSGQGDHVNQHPLFRELKSRQVEFYDRGMPLLIDQTRPAARRQGFDPYG